MSKRATKTQKYEKTPFAAALRHYIGLKGWGGQTFVSKKIKKSQSYISDLMRGRTKGDEETRRAIAAAFTIEYEDFLKKGKQLLSEHEETPDDECVNKNISTEICTNDPIVLEHYKVVREFPDSDLALEINQNLLEIAKLNPQRFNELAVYIRNAAGEVRANKPPNDDERRSGKDRRNLGKAGR